MKYKCDVCSSIIDPREGYSFSTSDVVKSIEYWHHYFKTDSLSEQDFGGDGSQVGMCLSIVCNSSSVWILCDKCARFINADNNTAKHYASKGENPQIAGLFLPQKLQFLLL